VSDCFVWMCQAIYLRTAVTAVNRR
jgi:hypothetical protein